MMVVRHRKNLARIAAGTEPKVSLRKKRDPARSDTRSKEPEPMEKDVPQQGRTGKIAVSWVVGLALFAAGTMAVLMVRSDMARCPALTIGPQVLSECSRASTGYQRAERVTFADGGSLLAVTCPRYNRLVLYRVTDGDGLELYRDLELAGKPVAVCVANDALYVLERPPGDSRHIKPGWWETFDFRGERVGENVTVGFYPDDMALSFDGRFAYVLTSGKGEGGADRPAPALDVLELDSGKVLARVSFDLPRDDPARLTLSRTGRYGVVTLHGSDTVASIDLTDPTAPSLIGRTPLIDAAHPYTSRADDDAIVMPVKSGLESTPILLAEIGECLAATLPKGSGIEIYEPSGRRSLGRLTIHAGALGLSSTRPTGVAFSPERGLIAVANRSGSVHLVAVRAPLTTESTARIAVRAEEEIGARVRR
jgi:glycerol-3-phosphate acyltransferase PlsY